MRTPRTSMRGELGKVTTIELLWVTLLIGGAAAGAMNGHARFGIWGVAIGMTIGLGVSCGIAYFLNLIIRSNSPAEPKTGRR